MISIIIVSWQVKDLLRKCLSSIYQFEKNIPWEIIVVDNASSDQTDLMIQQNFPRVRFISLKKNYGFAYACKRGGEIAVGDYFLFLNPDTEWHEEIFSKIINFIEQQKNLGVLGIKILNSNLTVQRSVRKLPTLLSQIFILTKLHLFSKKLIKDYHCLDFDYQRTQNVDQVAGAFFLINKVLYKKIGGFDENFFIWFEEVDFCYQCIKLGYNNYYFASTSIIHHGEESFKKIKQLKKQLIFNRSLLYYFWKNQSRLAYLILLIFIPLNLILTVISQILNLKPKHYL